MRTTGKSKLVAVIGMAAVTLVSCNVEDEIQDKRSAVRFTAQVHAAVVNPGTRASDNRWSEGDVVGIFMLDGSGTIEANKPYQIIDNITGELASPRGDMYYPAGGSGVNFIAYYPHKDNVSMAAPLDVNILTVQTAANQPDFDLLYSNNATGYSSHSTTGVNLTFEHTLSRLSMNCTADPNIGASLSNMVITIKGMKTQSTFQLPAGSFGTPHTVADITPRTLLNGREYNAIILPGSYTAGEVTVDFTLSTGEIFTWDVGAETFEGSNDYIYDILLSRTGIKVSATITPWTPTDRGSVTAR